MGIRLSTHLAQVLAPNGKIISPDSLYPCRKELRSARAKEPRFGHKSSKRKNFKMGYDAYNSGKTVNLVYNSSASIQKKNYWKERAKLSSKKLRNKIGKLRKKAN